LTRAGNVFSIASHSEEQKNMRIAKGLVLLLAVWIGLAAAFSGCTCVVNNYNYGTAHPSATYVANAPPAPKEEVQPAAPSVDYVWVAGHWDWSASEESWIWVGGVWVQPPDDGATWVGPEYQDNNGDWMYVPGYWQFSTPGAAETDEPATPVAPPGDLHWSGGGEVEQPGDGAPTEPATPVVPPGIGTTGKPEFGPATAGPKLIAPKKDELPVAGPTVIPESEGGAGKAEEEPHAVAPPTIGEDDPYGSGGDDGQSGSNKAKKPKQKDLKPVKPDMPDVVEHGAINPSAAPGAAPPVAEAGTAAEPEHKHGKHHKAKAEAKDEEGAKKVEPADAPMPKAQDKIKPHQ
jgi:hypothetical protein